MAISKRRAQTHSSPRSRSLKTARVSRRGCFGTTRRDLACAAVGQQTTLSPGPLSRSAPSCVYFANMDQTVKTQAWLAAFRCLCSCRSGFAFETFRHTFAYEQSEATRWILQPPFSTRTSTPSCVGRTAARPSPARQADCGQAAASFSRPPTSAGLRRTEAACLDGARGNSVQTSFLSVDISTIPDGSATPPSES